MLAGQVALITGGSSGIGFAIAQSLAAAGAAVVLTGRDEPRGRAAEAALRATGAQALFLRADIACEPQVREIVDTALGQFGTIDLLVNNAGPSGAAFGLAPIHALTTEIFDQTMHVGLYGALWCCRYVLPSMMQARRGAILNIGAIAAARAITNMGAYGMAKAALDALGRQVANDYAAYGIRCNTLLVGTVRPGAGDVSTLPEDFDATLLDPAIGKTTMLGRTGSYADVAAAALFLLSPASGYITGASIPLEGGALAKLLYPDYGDAIHS